MTPVAGNLMRRAMRALVLVAIALGSMSAGTGTAYAGELANVRALSRSAAIGALEIHSDGPAFPVRTGDVISTASRARAEIRFFDGSISRLDQDSVMEAARLQWTDLADREAIVVMRLREGSTFTRLSEAGGRSVQFITPEGVLTATGGTFSLSAMNGHIVVKVLSGTVRIASSNDTIEVAAGQGVALTSGEAARFVLPPRKDVEDPWVAYNLCILDGVTCVLGNEFEREAARPAAERVPAGIEDAPASIPSSRTVPEPALVPSRTIPTLPEPVRTPELPHVDPVPPVATPGPSPVLPEPAIEPQPTQAPVFSEPVPAEPPASHEPVVDEPVSPAPVIEEPVVLEPVVEAPISEPIAEPSTSPTTEPTTEPTVEPTPEPTVEPTTEPTVEPTPEPDPEPTPDLEPVPDGDGCQGNGLGLGLCHDKDLPCGEDVHDCGNHTGQDDVDVPAWPPVDDVPSDVPPSQAGAPDAPKNKKK